MIYKKFSLFLEAINQQWSKWFIDKMIDEIKSKLNCEITEEEYPRYLSTDKGIRKFTIKTENKKLLQKIVDKYFKKADGEYFLSYEIEDRGEMFNSSKGELILKLKLKKPSTRVKPPKFIYHQTDPSNVADIMKNGLIPKTSKGTSWDTIQLKYPNALFFTTDLNVLFYSRNRVTLVIDTDELPKSVKFWSDYNMYSDEEVKNIKYIMTENPISSGAIVNLLDENGKELEIEDGRLFYKGLSYPII
jgi:hypothetical protein